MGKKKTNHGIGKYGIAIELEDSISNNWFESEAVRNENYTRLRRSGSRDIKKISRKRG
jgi:hypothetical protein